MGRGDVLQAPCQEVPQARRELAACGREVVSHEISMIFAIERKSTFNKLAAALCGLRSIDCTLIGSHTEAVP